MSAPALDPTAPPTPVATDDDEIPGHRQRWWFWAAFTLAWLASGIAQGIASVAVPQLLKEWDPAGATGNLSILLTVGGAAILVTTPVFGRLSDRSMSRLGIRRPWILYGSLIALAGYVVQAVADSLLMLGAGLVLVLIGWGAVSMIVHTLFADQIRRRIRAIMSAVTGAASTVGILLGVAATGAIAGLGQAPMFLIPGVLSVILAMTLFFALDDIHRDAPADPLRWRHVAETFWLSPRRYPDFAWAWACRFLMTASIISVTSYLYLTISSRFGLSDPAQIAAVQTQATGAFTLLNLVMAFVFGVISDRTGRRKPTVVIGALMSAVGLVLAVAFGDTLFFLIGIAIVGAGQGAYIAADVALMTECLPSTEDAGKDLGIVALAYLVPGIVVPVFGFFVTRIGSPTGENFVALYVTAVIMAVLAAFAVTRVKGVR
ncbi:MFS family permease [Microbacterium resistens]|uniref:MFS family permease n=1 Tax=Microbacterium resistens TaxID=156977 RepID=A0ABU1S9R3_9MICO|nr:MFS transporter [Microbacterium resistens]MDR6865643.1 MFS family permease [Microbacterium resistens]